MNIPKSILSLRNEYMTRGDNQKVAALASSKKRKFTADEVKLAIKRGRVTDERIIRALRDYYTRKRSILNELSNVEITQ